jgi:hypothetical protein
MKDMENKIIEAPAINTMLREQAESIQKYNEENFGKEPESSSGSKVIAEPKINTMLKEMVKGIKEYNKEHFGINYDEEKDSSGSNDLVGGNLVYGFSPDGSFAPVNGDFVTPGFFFRDSYVQNSDGSIMYQSSSANDTSRVIGLEEIRDKVISNKTLKAYSPDLKRNNIYMDNHMLMMNYPRIDGSSELYRIDVVGNDILVQAEFENPCPLRGTNIFYKYISVPVDSDLGIKILSTPGYKIKDSDMLDPANSVFRIDERSI